MDEEKLDKKGANMTKENILGMIKVDKDEIKFIKGCRMKKDKEDIIAKTKASARIDWIVLHNILMNSAISGNYALIEKIVNKIKKADKSNELIKFGEEK